MRRSSALCLCIVAIALTGASCGASRAFEEDERIQIVAPRALQLVKPPFVMRWTGHVGNASAYAVFVDRAPMAPNRSLREYAEDECKGSALCPAGTAQALTTWLEQRGIFKAGPSVVKVPFVIERGASTEKDTRETHEAIVVALGPNGRRIGESAWTVMFRVRSQRLSE